MGIHPNGGRGRLKPVPLRGPRPGPGRRTRDRVAPSVLEAGTGRDLAGVVVLAGGGSRRFEGDKISARLGPRTLLEHVLAGLPPGLPAVLVGELPRRLRVEVPDLVVTREQPPGGGPAAGLAAGCAALPPAVRSVLVLGGDQPFCGGAGPRLLAALNRPPAEEPARKRAAKPAGPGPAKRPQAALGIDPDGRQQFLLAAYRVRPLRRALGELPDGRRMRDVVADLRVVHVPVTAREALDVDTREDLECARRLLGG
jgi:molybdenum cofactor guanylyltransferase